MTTRVVAVVGHVDHGKTSLVKALTGVDTDSLKEEKKRGLTISLGFAYRNTTPGVVNLIDAPGHSDFIRTTVSGLSGGDAIILVVSAVEGIQAQTREHVELARLLGIRRAIVAITKTDLCEKKECSKLIENVAFLLKGKGFLDPPIIPCSLHSNDGVQAIELELSQLFVKPVERTTTVGFFLPIDRVFSKSGAGTVVTGTLLGGAIDSDDEGVILPASASVSIRSLHVNGETVRSASSGARVAVALRGGVANSVSKGDVLCVTETYESSNVFDVALELADIENLKLKHMEHVTVLYGTGYATARVRLFEPTQRQSERVIYAQLKFSKRQVAFAGQKFILRRPALALTLAGGTVLDPAPYEHQRKKTLHLKVLEQVTGGVLSDIAIALAERDGGCISLAEITRLSKLSNARVVQEISRDFEIDRQGFAIKKSKLSDVKAAYIKELTQKHEEHPCRPYISLELIRSLLRAVHTSVLLRAEQGLIKSREICVDNGNVAVCGHDPFAVMSPDQMVAFDHFDSDLKHVGLSPLKQSEMKEKSEDFAELLVWCGRAVRLYNHALRQYVLLHAEAMKIAHATLVSTYPRSTTFTTSEARLLLGTSRKVIVPVLEYFDKQGVTQRQGNERFILKETFTMVSPKDQV